VFNAPLSCIVLSANCAACSAAAKICPCHLQAATWTATQRGLVTLTFEYLTLSQCRTAVRTLFYGRRSLTVNWCDMSAVARTTFLPILVILRHCVVELWANMHQNEAMTSLFWPLTFEVTAHVGDVVIVLHPHAKSEVRKPSSFEDVADYSHGVKRSGDLDLWSFDLGWYGIVEFDVLLDTV